MGDWQLRKLADPPLFYTYYIGVYSMIVWAIALSSALK